MMPQEGEEEGRRPGQLAEWCSVVRVAGEEPRERKKQDRRQEGKMQSRDVRVFDEGRQAWGPLLENGEMDQPVGCRISHRGGEGGSH